MPISITDDIDLYECLKCKVEETEHNSNRIFVIESYMNRNRHFKPLFLEPRISKLLYTYIYIIYAELTGRKSTSFLLHFSKIFECEDCILSCIFHLSVSRNVLILRFYVFDALRFFCM